ncbi:hypothetical protein D9M73_204950 [compost metagenome]
MYLAFEVFTAHQCDLHRIAYLDARQLGFLEIATDIERTAVHQGQQRTTSAGVVALTGQQVGDVATDRRIDTRALQVQFRLGQCCGRQLYVGAGQAQVGLPAHQLGLGDGNIGAGLFPLFAGDRRGLLQGAPQQLFARTLLERGLAGDNRRLGQAFAGTGDFDGATGMFDRQGITVRVDFQQQLALVHMLVVGDP